MKSRSLIVGVTVLASVAHAAGAQEPPKATTGYSFSELCSTDLTVGRKLRMRVHRIAPGGTMALRDHGGGPTVTYVVKGTMVARGAGVPDRVLHVGDGLAEGKDAAPLWVVNNTDEPVEFVAVDIFKP